MKKKILSFIFAICLILPCAFIFSACGDKPEPIMHTVTFIYDNGTENNIIEVEEGKFIEKPTDPIKTGYEFNGWYVDEFKWDFELVAVMKDTTLTAKWVETSTYYSVKFMVDGVQYGETQGVENRSDVLCPEINPTKTGYTFNGWKYDNKIIFNANGEQINDVEVADGMSFQAVFVANNYNLLINYYLNNTTTPISTPHTSSVAYDSEYSVISPSIIGYSPDIATVSGTMDNIQGKTINVYYVPLSCEITFNFKGGANGLTRVTAIYNADMPEITLPSRVGYNFVGYFDAETDGTKYYNADGTSAKIWDKENNTTLFAHWEIKDCQLTIKYNKINTIVEVAPTFKDEIPFQTNYEVESPTVVGYTPQVATVTGTMDDDQKEIIVYYTPNTNTPYTLTYYFENPNDDGFTKNDSLTEHFTGTTDTQTNIAISSKQSFDHFTFFADKSTLSGTILADGSLELKAYYKRELLTVTFNGNGKTLASGSETQTVKYGGNAIPPRYLGYSNGSLDGTISQYNLADITNITENKTNIQPSNYAPYIRIDERGTEDSNGDYILYGAYPQTDVTESMKDKLTEQTELPFYIEDWGWNNNGWINYGYGSLMWYKDINYIDGMKYRAIYFKQYRPKDATDSAYTIPDFTNQAKNGYYIENIYIFRFEPVKWRILTSSDGKVTLLSNIILDSQNFDGNPYNNNYSSSSIRTWLNAGFLSTLCQTDIQKNLLNFVNVDGNNDKVWLLSYEEATNVDYGFVDTFDSDPMRTRFVTDYAKMEGVYNYNYGGGTEYKGSWWLRTSEQSRNYVKDVVSTGEILWTSPESTYIGIVPTIQITLS